MRTQFTVMTGDILKVPSDLLLLKHAGTFYGVDSIVATELFNAKRCSKNELELEPKKHVIIDTKGTLAATKVMFLGTRSIDSFGYDEMREFARLALAILAKQDFPIYRLTTTIHGAGYGLDEEEALLSLVSGFESALETNDQFNIHEICFIERNSRRAESLASALNRRTSRHPHSLLPPDDAKKAPLSFEPIIQAIAADSVRYSQETSSAKARAPTSAKRHVFVAMPFSDAFEDVYQYGIYSPIRDCGLICEKTNESAFTGDILHRIRDRIETAFLVVAEMSEGRPNVYLEVGYAWGKGIPVIFCARHGEELHFDVSGHRCIYYKNIRQLSKDLEKLIRGILKQE